MLYVCTKQILLCFGQQKQIQQMNKSPKSLKKQGIYYSLKPVMLTFKSPERSPPKTHSLYTEKGFDFDEKRKTFYELYKMRQKVNRVSFPNKYQKDTFLQTIDIVANNKSMHEKQNIKKRKIYIQSSKKIIQPQLDLNFPLEIKNPENSFRVTSTKYEFDLKSNKNSWSKKVVKSAKLRRSNFYENFSWRHNQHQHIHNSLEKVSE